MSGQPAAKPVLSVLRAERPAELQQGGEITFSSHLVRATQTSVLVQIQIISSFILKESRLSSFFKCKWKCISPDLTVSHSPPWPRRGSQAKESITNLKISEAVQKCFTSNTLFFFFFFVQSQRRNALFQNGFTPSKRSTALPRSE